MRRHGLRLLGLVFWTVLPMPAPIAWATPAGQEGVRWHYDLEAAKTLARQTDRLVLVHVWTPNCGPCENLDQNVLNQPSVAAALEARFVPVRLNANENPVTAQGFGITRVPTDVILTPNGEVVDKLISPPTPAAYVAEVTQVAAQHAPAGKSVNRVVPTAPAAPLNSAYANLPVAPETPPVIAQAENHNQDRFASSAPGAVSSQQPMVHGQGPATTAPSPTPTAPLATNYPPVESQVGGTTNPLAASPPQAPPVTPITAASVPGAVEPTAPAAQPGAPDPKLLPPGAPRLGFEGYCPVSMRNQWKWVPGDPRWGIIHRGRTYWFSSEDAQQQFWADPDRYSPALSGMDPVLVIDHQQQVPGKREHSIEYDNMFYMFSSEATLQQFTASPERYATSARQAMGISRGRLVR